MPPPKLFLPILAYNHQCHTAYMFSILRLVMFLKDQGISATLFPITFESLVPRARNAAVAHFRVSDCSHLVFIDSDIEFQPEDVLRLVQAGESVVCGAYPQKWLHVEKMKAVFGLEPVPENPLALCTVQSVHLASTASTDGAPAGILEATYATTGFLSIRREVIERLMEAYPQRRYTNDIDGYGGGGAEGAYFYNLFCTEIHPTTKRYESEDYGFSRLWTAIGGKIYVVPDLSLKHHGWYAYECNLARQLELSASPKIFSTDEIRNAET